ncbi:curli assembly protein CsgC [Scandinavium sp. H11S7]|uniref:Curli assembly protein CsgC n=1 Tax=Scandinavium hiltneri TaxID=2926519 RepID=A0ABT2E5D0_9ENTR|nr:curli assembly chaperone CsgC [Scandinavium hiltneri]MCS2163088.1 curli assembly protein CsgC [Scandinavium hiltneri]
MQSIILAALVVGKLSFDTHREKEMLTIIPMITLPVACECQVTVETQRKGDSGQSISRQQSMVSIPSDTPLSLGTLMINAPSSDEIQISVTVSNGKEVNLSNSWSPGVQKS